MQVSTPPFVNKFAVSSTLPPVTPPPPHHDEVDTKVFTPSISAITTPGTLQALTGATTPLFSQNGAMGSTPVGLRGSPLSTDFSPSPNAQGFVHQDVIQEVSPESPVIEKPSVSDPPLDRLMKQVGFSAPCLPFLVFKFLMNSPNCLLWG